MSTMRLETLRVVHRDGTGGSTDGLLIHGFFTQQPILVKTCQRSLWIGRQTRLADNRESAAELEIFTGKQAYEFLLQFASGLLSAIPGETNVFGQLKQAWHRHQASFGADLSDCDRRLMSQLFTDTKRIRNRHLQLVGGLSYGTLVRDQLALRRNEPVLIVGAGSLARSIAPALRKYRLATWSRRSAARVPEYAVRLFGPGHLEPAACWADHLVFCTPPARAFEQTWLDVLQRHPAKTVLHLGYRDTPAWWHGPGISRFWHLEHLFALRRVRAEDCSLKLMRARDECRTLAENRAGESRHVRPVQFGPDFGFAVP
jgi:hypothetical protein